MFATIHFDFEHNCAVETIQNSATFIEHISVQ